MKSVLQFFHMEERTDNQNVTTNLPLIKWRSRLVLFLRWLLGGLAGIGISAWICFGLISHAIEIPPILSAPFAGHMYLFQLDAVSFRHVSDFFITFPVLFWGLIGALLTSGRKEQTKIGTILLLLYIILGYVSLFQVLMHIPT